MDKPVRIKVGKWDYWKALAAVGAIDNGARGRCNLVEGVDGVVRDPAQITPWETLDLF